MKRTSLKHGRSVEMPKEDASMGLPNVTRLDKDEYNKPVLLQDEPHRAKTEFVRNNTSKQAKDKFSLFCAFSCAWNGFKYVVRSQRNMKIHLIAAVTVITLGFIFKINAISWTAIFLCIGCVIAAECFNTALESVVDLVSPKYHKLARCAKDCAAAGVLVFAGISVAVAAIIFISCLLSTTQTGILLK